MKALSEVITIMKYCHIERSQRVSTHQESRMVSQPTGKTVAWHDLDKPFLTWLLVITLLFPGISHAQESSEKHFGPYRTSALLDGSTMAGGILIALSASLVDNNHQSLSVIEIQTANKNSINAIDRFVAGNYSQTQMSLSDAALIVSFASPLGFFLNHTIRTDWSTISMMYLEMALYSNFIPSFGKGSVRRFRPYVYSPQPPLSVKQDVDAVRSFFSGHATRSFAAGVMTAIMYEDYFPDSQYRTHVWIASLGLASSVAILRVTSGAHFPSDVITGAIIGSGIGYMIPYLHRTNASSLTITPAVLQGNTGINISYHF